MKKYILLLLLSSLCSPAFAQKLPKPADWVNDYAGVMDAAAVDNTKSLIAELEQKTSAEIAVVTVKNLGNDTIENYAATLFKEWGIGKKGKNNGILLLASIEERKVKIEVGYGLEGILNDGLCGEILDRFVVPQLKNGAYGTGMFQGTRAIATVIAADAGVQLTGEGLAVAPQKKISAGELILKGIFFIAMIILFIRHPFLFLLFMGMGGGGSRGGGGFGGGFGGFGGGSSGGGGSSRGF
ncbi:MAG: TPM domain-containing protein [Elusimicrobia bacterium]|nr:TPM domain-containing protein [Elusimicrobiota bacterium]